MPLTRREIEQTLEKYRQNLQQMLSDEIEYQENQKYLEKVESKIRELINQYQEAPANSQETRNIEQQIQHLLDGLKDLFHPIEFVNRVKEIQSLTGIYCPPYLLLNAPMGYGKTRLIRQLKSKLQKGNWLCIHLELSREKTYTFEELAIGIVGQLGGACVKDSEKTTSEQIGYEIGRCILQALKQEQKNVLLSIDEIETLEEPVTKALLNECIPAIQEGLAIADMSLKFHLICAGRYIAHWKQWSSKLPLELMSLTSFDFAAAYETVEKFASTSDAKTADTYKKDFAALLMHMTGGHPGCMVKILREGYGIPIRQLIVREQEYYECFVKPVIMEIQNHIPGKLQDIFEKLSVCRIYNNSLLRALIDEKVISYPGSARNLEEDLMATYLVERKGGFIQDDIIRRLLAIKIRKERGRSHHDGKPEAFLMLCEKVKNIYETYISEENTTYYLHALTLECLYQELQAQYHRSPGDLEAKIVLYKKFFAKDGILQRYLCILLSKPDIYDNLQNLWTVLQNGDDWEIRFIFNYFLGQRNHYTEESYQCLLEQVEQIIATSP